MTRARMTAGLVMTLALLVAAGCGEQEPVTEAATADNTQTATAATTPFDPARAGTTALDVTYCTAAGTELKMDLYYPQAAAEPAPVVIYIHGGGWSDGDKADGAGAHDIPALVDAGFLVASVNYRLAPEYQFPAMIEDVSCAVRHLRARAVEYNLDPERIGAWGGSAGGHLAALLGTAEDGLFAGSAEYGEESSRVQAVVDMFGPSDLTRDFEGGAGSRLGSEVFGTSDLSSPALEEASPLTHVSADDPPFLILHGEDDRLVPLDQSQLLYDAMLAAGVPAELVVVKNAGHSFKPEGGRPEPGREEISRMIVEFFSRELK